MIHRVRLEGVRPLLIQSDRMADPMDKVAQEKRRLAKSKDKTSDAVQTEMGRLEWFGSLYLDECGCPTTSIPMDNVIRAIRDAAAFEKRGKEVYEQVLIGRGADLAEALLPIEHDGPKDLDKMWLDPRFSLRKTVVQQRNRVVRVRPRFPTWALEFHVSIGGTCSLNRDDIHRFLSRAGSTGLGTWRPRYGHFRVARFDLVEGK